MEKASKRILRFLQRRGVVTLVSAPGDREVTVVADETMAEKAPLRARLLAAATSGTAVDRPSPTTRTAAGVGRGWDRPQNSALSAFTIAGLSCLRRVAL